jgi:RHS repeat-associated protein
MPFGEEIDSSITAIRNINLNYGDDGIKKKFTSYERDSESELDYAQARYYNPKHGRFTGVDPILSSATIYDPQTWNRYSYVLNMPLKYTDPFGMYICDGDKKQCQNIENGLKKGQEALKKLDSKSEQYKLLNRALNTYGKAGVDNGLTIKFGATTTGAPAETGGLIREDKTKLGNKLVTADNPTGRDITITFDPKQHDSVTDYATDLAHEGSHAADRTDFIAALPVDLGSDAATAMFNSSPLNPTKYDTETTAYRVSAAVSQGLGYDSLKIGKNKIEIWNSGWKQADLAAGKSKQGNQIDKVLAEPKSKGGLYEITRDKPGPKIF